jgi:hypothetical protein
MTHQSVVSERDMTARKRVLAAWAFIMIVELAILLMALYVSTWFAVPFLAAVFVIPSVLKRIVCPKCGTPVTYQGTLYGIRIQGGFIRRKCQQCGWDLDKNL